MALINPRTGLYSLVESGTSNPVVFHLDWIQANAYPTSIQRLNPLEGATLAQQKQLHDFVRQTVKDAQAGDITTSHGYRRHGYHYTQALDLLGSTDSAQMSYTLAPAIYLGNKYPPSLWITGTPLDTTMTVPSQYIEYIKHAFSGTCPDISQIIKQVRKSPREAISFLYMLNGGNDRLDLQRFLQRSGIYHPMIKSTFNEITKRKLPPTDFYDPIWYLENLAYISDKSRKQIIVRRTPRTVIPNYFLFLAQTTPDISISHTSNSDGVTDRSFLVSLAQMIETAYMEYIIQLPTGEQLRFNKNAGINQHLELATQSRLFKR